MTGSILRREFQSHYNGRLRRVDFSGADLTSASVNLVWYERCAFVRTDLRQASIEGHFTFCDLRGATFRGADLRGSSFTGCDLTGSDLRDCDLRGVRFGRKGTGTEYVPTDLTGARLDRALVEDVELVDVIGWPFSGR